MSKKFLTLAILIVVILLTSTACTLPWQKKKVVTPVSDNTNNINPLESVNTVEPDFPSSGEIKKFNNLEELQTFLEQHKKITNLSSSVTSSVNEAKGVESDYSKTNVQVAGVDEADIMKTDGNFIYLLDYNDLYIIKAKPAVEASIVTKITFKSRPQEFYISGDRLVVFGYDLQIFNDQTFKSFKRQGSYTYLKIFDIADPKNPKQIKDLNIEGSYSNSRLIGDYLYFVTNNYQNYIAGEPLLPRILDSGQVLAEQCGLSAKCYSPNIFYFDTDYNSFNFTSVNAINIKNVSELISGDIYLLSADQNFYVSPNNIYITYTSYLNEYDLERDLTINLLKERLSADNQLKISKIEASESFVLSDVEKKNKVYQLIQDYISSLDKGQKSAVQTEIENALKQELMAKAKELEKTMIYKIAFSGSSLNYVATASVPGRVLNQFSLDESNGYLRIATTKSQSWSRFLENSQESFSNVYVLDDKLKVTGSLENLAAGERIYAVRFMGNRAYLVTYKETDPLLVIDLQAPSTPKLLGELKIPGYSTYLHPYSDNILLGFGRDTELSSNGQVLNKGLKLALFDVSNPSAPKELDSYIVGNKYSNSVALSDHKAFLISPSKNLISIPVSLNSGEFADRLEFSGALVFGVNNNKLKLRGRIDHSDNGNYTKQDYWNQFSYFDNSAKRSLYIDNALYTFSNKFLKINNLNSDNLESLKIIDLLPGLSKDLKEVSTSSPFQATSSAEASSTKEIN